MRKNLLLLILATTLVTAVHHKINAQTKNKIEVRNKNNDPLRKFSPDKELGLALGLFNEGSFFNAIDYFQDLKERDERNPYLSYILGECYAKTRDYVPAAHYYVETYYLDKKDYPRSAYYAGQMFKQQGEYQQAIQWFNQFLTDNKKTTSTANQADDYNRLISQKEMKDLKKKAQVEIDGCNMAIMSIKEPGPYNIFNCGPNVNSAYTELSPYPLGDTALLFSTVNANNLQVYTAHPGINRHLAEHFMIAQKQKGYVDSFQWPLPF